VEDVMKHGFSLAGLAAPVGSPALAESAMQAQIPAYLPTAPALVALAPPPCPG
jgi:hypothetical protein